MCPYTTSALHSPCLARALFANKQKNTAKGRGLGAQCLFVRGARVFTLCFKKTITRIYGTFFGGLK